MVPGLNIDLKHVSSFSVIQADGPLEYNMTVKEEKIFEKLSDALALMETSEAPVRILNFYHNDYYYTLTPIEDSEEYHVERKPVLH